MSLFSASSVILYTVSPVLIIIATEVTLLILRLFGYLYYKETGMGKTSIITNLSKGFYTSLVDNDPSGIVIGYGYVGYIQRFTEVNRGVNEPAYKIKIICSPKMWEILNKAVLPSQFNTPVFRHNGIKKDHYMVPKITPSHEQEKIINNIVKIYNNKHSVSALIYGEPGSGKSSIAIILAQRITGSILIQNIDIFGLDNLRGLVTLRNKTGISTPLVIVIDEFDTQIIKKVTDNNTKETTLEIIDKKNTNRFFDEISVGFVSNVYLIMTTNKNPKYFNDIDPSIIRENRVDMICELNKNKPELPTKFRSKKR
jgi:hypothetical protein